MLDGIYRALLRLLPREFDGRDRTEMWETYRQRVGGLPGGRAGSSGRRARLRELFDLIGVLVQAWRPRPSFDSLRQDVRIGIRSLVRSPLVTGLAVLSLGLGIGATTALFSALDVWLLRPLPLPNADRLVGVYMANNERGWTGNAFSPADYAEWSRDSRSVSLAAWALGSYNMVTGEAAERVRALQVTANMTDVLGLRPSLGRGFVADEGTSGGPRVVLLTNAFWRQLGEDPDLVGRSITLDGIEHTVVGVLPPDQGIPGYMVDVWTPLRLSGNETRAGHFLWGVGLLGDGVGLDAARAELAAVASRAVLSDPDRTFPDARVVPFRDAIFGRQYQQGGIVLGGAVLFVLLIACANIVNILLARGLHRTHEMAVRGTMGARRWRIIQQLLTESFLIAVAGGLLGIAFASMGIDLLLTYALPRDQVAGWNQIALNGRMLLGAAALTMVCAFAFGIFPAVQASKVDLRQRLADQGRGGPSGRRRRIGSALVVAEISASLVLVALTGLMIRTMVELRSVDMGLRIEEGLVFRLDVPAESAPDMEGVTTFYETFEERLATLPGVSGATVTSGHPLSGWSSRLYEVPGTDNQAERARMSAEHRSVTPAYLDAMGMRMIAGRWLDPVIDVAGGQPVVVVSRALAQRWWPNPADALDQRLVLEGSDRLIVGVVEGVRMRGPGQPPPPIIFEPFSQRPVRSAFLTARTDTDAEHVVPALRELVRDVDPNLVVFDLQTMQQALAETLGPQRAGVRILGALGALALVLTLVGIYGVVAHSVGRRKQEMGLRLALGAHGAGLIRMMLAGNARLALLGLAIGLAIAMAAGQALSFLLAGVSPRDPAVLTAVSVFLFLAIMVASYIPSRRAARVDPVRALREE